MTKANILIADDHQLIRESLKRYLTMSGFNVVACAENSEDLLRLASSYKGNIDVILTDLNMPGDDGISLVKKLKQISSENKLIIFSADKNSDSILSLLHLGISSYLFKDIDKHLIVDAISTVCENKRYFPKEISDLVIEMQFPKNDKKEVLNDSLELSLREEEVLKLTGEGFTNHEIGSTLGISYRTVDTHKRNMLKKTGAKNMTHLVKISMQLQFIN